MLSYCTDYTASMPDITVYMNCDTRLAINLRLLNLADTDELIFTIKNYNYVDSPYAFMFRARNANMDQNGEVIFTIPPAVSKRLKPGAFYNLTVLLNAFDTKQETEYRKLTDNGNIIIEYGAQDLLLEQEILDDDPYYEIISVRIEPTTEESTSTGSLRNFCYDIVGIRIEQID